MKFLIKEKILTFAEIFLVDRASWTIRDIIVLLFSATVPLHPLLKHENILSWADSRCSISGHFAKEEFCDMGPFGTFVWPLCFLVHGRFKTQWSYSVGVGAQLWPPQWRFPSSTPLPKSVQNWFTMCVVLQLTCYTSLSSLAQKIAAGVLQRHQFGWNRF